MYSGFNKFMSPRSASPKLIDTEAIKDKKIEDDYDILEELGKSVAKTNPKRQH